MHLKATRRVCVSSAALLALLAPSAADARFGRGTLERGDSGRDVKILQKYLNKAGIDTTVDGEFGSGTARALKKFEKSAQLTVDGRLEPKEAKALKRVAKRGAEGTPEGSSGG